MTLLVVDASVAAAFAISSQSTTRTVRLISEWGVYQPIAPYVFDLEVPWLLLKQERRTSTPGFARRQLEAIGMLDVNVQPALESPDLERVFDTAERHGTGLYDAHYLLLAIDTEGVLVSKDVGLLGAALRFGVDVLDVR